jgi:hypothetical protein
MDSVTVNNNLNRIVLEEKAIRDRIYQQETDYESKITTAQQKILEIQEKMSVAKKEAANIKLIVGEMK